MRHSPFSLILSLSSFTQSDIKCVIAKARNVSMSFIQLFLYLSPSLFKVLDPLFSLFALF